MRYQFTPIRKAISKRQEITSVGEDTEETEPLCTVSENTNFTASMENCMRVPQKTESRASILQYFSGENRITYLRDTFTPMFTSALFTTKVWEQPMSP